jgi:glycerol-3-phosphate dehydrogenase (NAD+)
MIQFCRLHKKESTTDIYLESCGIADLIATASGGRNYRGAKQMIETKQSLKDIERDHLNGQSLQGPGTAQHVYDYLQSKNLLEQFPLLRDAHLICQQRIEPIELLTNLSTHPTYDRTAHSSWH